MTENNKLILSMDIGTSKVCCVVAKNDQKSIDILRVTTLKHNNLLDNDNVNNNKMQEIVYQCFKTVTKDLDLKKLFFAISLSGNHILSKNIILNVPKNNPEKSLITKEDINRVIKIAKKIEVEEDQKIIHVIPRTYTLDGIEGIRNPLGMHTFDLKAFCHVILGSISEISRLNKFTGLISIIPDKYLVGSVVSAKSLLTASERESGAILIDIGAGITDIAIFHKSSIIHPESIPIGGNIFTNDISVAFDINFDNAENLKLMHGSVTPERVENTKTIKIFPQAYDDELEITKRELAQLLKDRASELIRMIGYRLDNENISHLDINQIVLTGGTSKMDGMLQLTRFLLQKRVRNIDENFEKNLEGEKLDPSTSCAISLSKLALTESIINPEIHTDKNKFINKKFYLKKIISLKNYLFEKTK